MAHQIGSIEKPRNPSGFPLLRFRSLLCSDRFGGGTFQNENSPRLKINCSARERLKEILLRTGFFRRHAPCISLRQRAESPVGQT